MTRRNRVEKRRWRHGTMWYSSSGFSWADSAGTGRFFVLEKDSKLPTDLWELRCCDKKEDATSPCLCTFPPQVSEIATAATFYQIISFIPPGNRLSISEMATA